MTHPIDLPEIVDLISPYCSQRDFYACVLVSRRWNRAFGPHTWREIRLKKTDTEPENCSATVDSLKLHIHQIQTLQVQNILPDSDVAYLDIDFPQLRHLGLKFSRSQEEGRWRVEIWHLLRQLAPQLQTLAVDGMHEFNFWGGNPRCCSTWRLLQGCQRDPGDDRRLSELRMNSSELFIDEMTEDDAKILLQLKSLVLENISLSGSKMDIKKPRLPKLTRSKIENLVMKHCAPLSPQYYILESCEELRSLTWDYSGYTEHLDTTNMQFLQGLQQGRWSHIESLTFRMVNLWDRELAEILKAIGPLRSLTMDRTNFGRICTDTLVETKGKHIRTLTSLSLLDCSRLSGALAHRLLCSLPNLQVFQARVLTAQSVSLVPEPWICSGLREFRVGLVNGERESQVVLPPSCPLPPLPATTFLTRIAELRHLQVFEILRTITEVGVGLSPVYSYQKLTMDSGLESLASLRSLRELRLRNPTGQEIGLDEARWMVQNWPRLEIVDLRGVNSQKNVGQSVAAYFKEHKVTCFLK